MNKLIAACVFSASTTLVAGAAFGEGKITLGFPGGVGPTDVPAILALKSLADEGWTTDYIEFDSPDIQTQALLNGDIQVASMGPSTVIAADLAGADLKMVARNNLNDLLVVTGGDVAACADLDGKIVAYHSDGSTSTAHLRRYLADTCPEAAPQFIVLSGSANRAAALLNGQIAGTIVRLEDWIAATSDVETDAHVLAFLSDNQSTLLTQTIVVSQSAMGENTDAVKTMLDALAAQMELATSDPSAFSAAALPYLSGADEAGLTEVYTQLAERGIFSTDIALSEASITDTIGFYEQAGRAEPGKVTIEMIADLSIVGR